MEALVHIESILNLYEFMMSLLPPDRGEDDEVLEVHGERMATVSSHYLVLDIDKSVGVQSRKPQKILIFGF